MQIVAIDPTIVAALERADLDALAQHSHRRSLAELLRHHGPIQTVAFLRAKKNEKDPPDPLLRALELGLAAVSGHASIRLDPPALARMSPLELLALGQRLTRIAVWIDRLVEAHKDAPAADCEARS
jgi:hypothetical protein